jgi:sterol desaturase/sphingolipid hydroxylase (fatty acid hydroxylase superfamily)
MWIAFRGVLGRIFVSHAHHQVHHSANPKHFNKNLGSCLALWDRMFGTLYVSEKTREPLTIGFPGEPDAHTVKGELVDPFINAAGHIWPKRPALPVAECKQA